MRPGEALDLRRKVLGDLVSTGVGGRDRPRPLPRAREAKAKPLIRREKRA